jgi:hypothetical protein
MRNITLALHKNRAVFGPRFMRGQRMASIGQELEVSLLCFRRIERLKLVFARNGGGGRTHRDYEVFSGGS